METKIPHQNKIYVRIVTFFLLLTVSAIFVILHFALSKATIKINSNLEEIEKQVLVELQPESENVTPESLIGKIIETKFEITATSTSSYEEVPSEKAGGYVTIYNNNSTGQPLVATTRLLTSDNKLYRIQSGVIVPSGGSVEVWAEADQAGEEFAIGPQEKMTIPGLNASLQDIIYASAPDGMKQAGIPTYIVTDEDLTIVETELKALAEKQALEELNKNLNDSLKVNKEKLFISYESVNSTAMGSQDKEVSITKKVTARALVFSESDLKKKAEEKFKKELNDSQTLVSFVDDSLQYEIIELNFEENKAVLEVNLKATINSEMVNIDINKEELMGLDEQGVKEYLKQYNVEGVEVKFFPMWIKTVPKLKDHIIIE